jgi:hypothetical protein
MIFTRGIEMQPNRGLTPTPADREFADGLMKENESAYQKQAMFRVVQARAGKCPIPKSSLTIS